VDCKLIKDWLIGLLNKKVLFKGQSVVLSSGVVYLRPLTNGLVNKVRVKSCIAGDLLNEPLFFQLMDYELTRLSKKQIDSLSVDDGNILRDAVRDLLIKNGIVKVEGAKGDFSAEDIRKIEDMKSQVKTDLAKWKAEGGSV
jgi:hypothetical protein